MGWLDPIECDAARNYLALGNPRAAAKQLLTAKNQEHRTVCQLLLECHQALVEEARALHEQRERSLALELFDLADRCTPLGAAAALLQKQVAAAKLDKVTKLIAKDRNADGNTSDNQETVYLFEDSVNASLATNEIYPDSSDTTSSGTDQIKYEFNVGGSRSSRTDQRGTVIDYTYNNRRQLELSKVTTLGGADGHVRSIKREYDSLGRLELVSSYSDTGGTGTVRNQIEFEYNGLGQVEKSYQSHEGAVNKSTSPKVQYTYDTTAASNVFTRNHRLQSVTYPDGRVTYYDYDTDDDDFIHHRLSMVQAIYKTNTNGTKYTNYDYTGRGRLAIVDYPSPDVKLDLYQGTSGTYAGYDRFGRVKDQFWDGYNSTSDVSRVKHGYDYAGNRLWREDVIAANNSKNHDELYTFDGIHRLTNAERGNLNGTYTAISTKNFANDWTLDALGNWPTFKQDNDGNGTWDLDQDRTHNDANEIGTMDIWANPSHDGNGNMIAIPDQADLSNSLLLTYDAWNRLVKVTNQSLQNLAEFEYDGLNRRIIKKDSQANDTYDYYYNTNWQVLEVRKNSDADPLEEFVWHPFFIDAIAVRFYDSDTNGSQVDQYYGQDGDFNVVAVFSSSGSIEERYQYSPYGVMSILDAGFGDDADGVSDIDNTTTFKARQFDPEVGLNYFRHRNYDCETGRFISRDPINYFSQQLSLYGFLGQNPMIRVDPSGLVDFNLHEPELIMVKGVSVAYFPHV